MVSIKNKFKIQEFSRLCGVTVRTLRHYEAVGLLQPAEVDDYSHYRFYHVRQMQTMANIRRLKSLGFSLDEILDLFARGNLNPTIASLEQKIADCERQLNDLSRRRQALFDVLNSQNLILSMEKFSIQSLPAVIVASHRQVISSYSDLGRLCVEVIGPEMARLGCHCPEPGYCFTVEHNEYRPTNIDIEYCEQVDAIGPDSPIIQFKTLPEVPKAVCMKHYGPYERLYDSYLELFAYLEQQRLQCVGAPRACYVDGAWNQSDPDKWLTIIQVPVHE